MRRIPQTIIIALLSAILGAGCAGDSQPTAPWEQEQEDDVPVTPPGPEEPVEPEDPDTPPVAPPVIDPPAEPDPPLAPSYGEELTVSMHCDFFGIVRDPALWDLNQFDAHVAEMMAQSRAAGVDRIFYRVDATGEVVYPSTVMTVFNGTNYGDAQGLAQEYSSRTIRVLTEHDPLETCIRHAHAQGMEIYAWITPFDRAYGAADLWDSWLYDRPGYQWITPTAGPNPSYGSGDVFFGMPCFAYPEVRARQVAEFQELSATYDLDGFAICWRKHGSGPGNFEAGFNEPVLRDYTARWGQNPLELDIRPDTEAGIRFSTLKSEYVTQLLREIRQATGPLPLLIMNAYCCASPQSSYRYVDYDAIVSAGLSDEVWLWRTNPVAHSLPQTWWYHMYSWSGILTEDEYTASIHHGLREAYGKGCAGISFHEQYFFEKFPNLYNSLQSLLDSPAGE